MGDRPYQILGLCNGSKGGNSEILLKAALQEIQSASPRSTKTSWIHVPSVLIPRNPEPLKTAVDVSLGNVASMTAGDHSRNIVVDDRRAILDAILDADALIFATPVYSHQPPGFLKVVTDRILGPYTDACFVQRVLERKKAGDPKFKDQPVDLRVLKPRVVGFLVVAGSTRTEHFTMALPTLHQFVYPLHAKVVDQVVLSGYANAGSVIYKKDGQAVERARVLGRNVASQLGKEFDIARYLGPEPEGACPHCHLAQLDFFGGNAAEIGCIVCGAKGNLIVDNGRIVPVWTPDLHWSCITMEGKRLHVDHIQEAGMEEANALQSFSPPKAEAMKKSMLDIKIPVLPLPSGIPDPVESPPSNTPKGLVGLESLWEMIKYLRVSYHRDQ
ncbi:flavoprotein-like protein [Xylariales sp. AK1849]|nr:flavoprotein-like protein [Xylariales sp. AK1849]